MDSNLWKQRAENPREMAFREVKEAIIDKMKDASLVNSYITFGVMNFDEDTGVAQVLIKTYRIFFSFSYVVGSNPVVAFIETMQLAQQSPFAHWFDPDDMNMWYEFLISIKP